MTANRSLRWRSSWRIICIRRTPKRTLYRERGHPVNSADPSVPSVGPWAACHPTGLAMPHNPSCLRYYDATTTSGIDAMMR